MDGEPGGVDGGRIDLDVVADLSALERGKLQRTIDKKIKGAKARIQAEIDARRLERMDAVKVRASVDQAALKKDLADALKNAAVGGGVEVKVTPKVDRDRLKDEIAAAARDSETTVKVHTSTTQARDELGRFVKQHSNQPINVDVRINQAAVRQAGQLVATLGKVAATAAGFTLAAAGAGALASGLFAVTAAGSQAVGVLSLLPGLVGAGVQGLATMLVGFSGVGSAYSALGKADKASGASAEAAATAREAAAERIKQAERSIRDATHARMLAGERVADSKDAAVEAAKAVVAAERRVAEAVARVAESRERAAEVAADAADRQEQAARRVEQAERRYAESQRASKRATDELNEARKQAKERLEDLALAVRGGALDEEGAKIGIERAKQQLEKTLKDPFASDLDKREADLAYRQALLRLDEVRERNGDLREEQSDATARGIEGSKEVEAAKQRVVDTLQAEKDAEYELGRARKEQAKSAVDSAKAIETANKGISEAIRGVAAAQEDVTQAKKAQVRAARDVREALWDQMLAAERLKDSELELAKARKAAATAGTGGGGGGVDPAAQALAELSPKMREFVRYLHSEVRPALRDLKWEVQDSLAPHLKTAVEKSLPLLDTLKGGMVETADEIGKVFSDPKTGLASLFSDKQFNIDVRNIMAGNAKAVGAFGRAGVSAFSGLRNVMRVAVPFVDRFSGKVENLAQTFEDWTDETRRDGSMAKYFQTAWDAASKLWRIVKGVGGAILAIGRAAAPAGGTMLEDLATAAEEFNRWANQPEVQARLKKFFDELVPLMRAAGGLIKDVAKFLGHLTESVVDDGTLTDFVNFLRGVVQWLDKIAQNPAIGEIAKWVLIVGLVAAVFGTLAAKLASVSKGLGLLAKAAKGIGALTGLSKLFGGGGKDDSKPGGGKGHGGDCQCCCGDSGGGDGGSRRKKGKGGKSGGGSGTGFDRDTPKKKPTGGGDSDSGGGKHRKPGIGSKLKGGGKGAASLIGGVAATLGLDALADIDWAKELPKTGGKLAGLAGKIKGGIAGTLAGLLVDPLADLISGGQQKGARSAGAGALKGAAEYGGYGALIGSVVPGLGTGIGAAVGGGLGAAKGGLEGYLGERQAGAGLGALFTTQGIQVQLKELGRLFGGAGATIKEQWASLWSGLDKGTSAGSDGLSQRLGLFLDGTNGKFVSLAQGAPKNIQSMWADIQKDTAAGLIPSQAKIDAFVQAGGAKFLTLGKDAPKNLQEGWRQVNLGIDTFTSVAANKLGVFAGSTSAKFLTIKNDAPKHIRDAWSSIQADIDAGVKPSQAKIDAFVAAGGARFVDLKKNAPQALRDALGEINRDLLTGLSQASAKLGTFVQQGGAKFLSMRRDAPPHLRGMWGDIQRDIDAGRAPSQAKIDAFVKAGGGSFLKLSKDAPASTKKAWSDIAAGVDPGLAPAKKGVAAATKAMEDAFGTAKTGIGKIWDKLPGVLRTPIAWIVNNAYGKIAEVWNGIARAVQLPELPKISLGFAKGGIVPGHGVAAGYAPGKDRMLAAVAPGEAWLRPELTRALGTAWVDGGNRAARTGGVAGAARFLAGAGLGFAKGGTVPGGPKATAKASGTTGGKKAEQSPLDKALANVSAKFKSLFKKGLGAGARVALNPVKAAISSAVGDRSALQRLLGAVPRKVIDNVIARFDAKDREITRDRGGPLPPGRTVVRNGTGRDEWVLTPGAVASLGGPRAVAALNEGGVASLYRGARTSSRAAARPGGDGRGAGSVTLIVNPQPGQDEHQIGDAAARRLAARVR
ncbi:hypothetical protein [Streptosporangium roseum]|uniref:hypothetical protein n=1 Tax=Streptosporangium roseum TaxID=2001 RepID=UPI0033171C17